MKKILLFLVLLGSLIQGPVTFAEVPKEHKKVLFLIPWLVLGGMDRAFIDMMAKLDIPASEMDVCIVLHQGGVFEQFLRKDVRRVTLEQAFNVQYDVVASYSECIEPPLWVDKIHARKKVQWIHNDLALSAASLKNRKVCNGIDYFIFVGDKSKVSFEKIHPDLASKTRVIYNVIDSDLIRKRAQEPVVGMNIDKNKLCVVTVARYTPQKAIDRAVRVHKRLNDAGISFQWFVIGYGEEKEKLEQLIARYKLQGKFVLLGERMNSYPYMKRADIFALPSLYEGRPVVITEAQILGRPIIMTDVSGARESITSGENGLIVANNEDAIYRGMKKILTDKEMRKKFMRKLTNYEYNNEPSLKQLRELLQ